MEKILVLGLGNTLQSDDGVGVRVIDHVKKSELPAGVEIVDGGTAGLGLLDIIAARRTVIIVDAVQGGGEPGTIYRLVPEDVESGSQRIASIHQFGLPEVLAMAQQLGCRPENVVIFGVEPKIVDWGIALSAEVAAAVPQVAQLVIEEARRSILSGEGG